MSVRAIALLLSLLVIPAPAAAQGQRASLRGTVLSPNGEPAGNMELRIINEATNETRRVTSDDEGRYAVAELDPGRYRIEVDDKRYRTFAARVELAVRQDQRMDLPLALETFAVVDVRGSSVTVERDSPALTTRIDNRLVTELPLDGRNFLELSLLAPGTAPAPQGSASSVRGDFALVVNGAREDFTGYLLDGIYNVDPKLGTVGVRPPVDAIREFEVRTSTYDATFGRNAGGQINIVTHSGSNRFTGAAYEFYRNGSFASRNYFAPKGEDAPDYSRHQLGGAIGGPIKKDRTFFFADYELTRLREGITRVTNVPDLSTFLPPLGSDPRGLAILGLYPAPNRSTLGANFVSSPTLRDGIHQFDGRIDQAISGGNRLTLRYSFSDRDLYEPFAGPGFSSLPGFGNDVTRRAQNFLASYTHAASSTLVNDLRFGFNRVQIGVFPEDNGITNASVGLPAFSSDPRHVPLSFITVQGYSPLGHEYNNPQESTSNTVQILNTAAWSRGSHLVKLGGEWYGIRQSARRDVQARGFLNFIDGYATGSALMDLLFGFPVLTGGAALDNPQNLRASSWSLFAHDDWRASPSLTISAGVRYDYAVPPYDQDDRANLYDVATGQLVQVGAGGVPRGGYEADRNNFAPRVGFAWSAGPEAPTVVRGGYGIYYNTGALATSEGLYFNPPFFNLRVFFPFQGLPPITLADPFPATFPIPVPPSATAFQRDLETPWMQHWNLTVQRAIGRSRSVELSYVGSRGHALISARDANQPAPSASPFNPRPNPAFGDITLIESRATSSYNAIQLKVQQRMEGGLSALLSYTYGKSTDDASGFFTSAGDANFPQNSLDPDAEEARSSFDVRHRASLGFSWDLPFSGNVWVRDWQLHGIVTFNSGRPFTVALHPDIDQSNTGRSNLGFGNNDRPNVSGDGSVPAGDRTADRWFNTAAFSFPAFGSFGNAGRNILEGPGYRNLSLGIARLVPIGANARLQLRLEAFNLFNTDNFDLPDAFLGSPTFGRILSAGSPRRIQFGVKALF